MKVITSPVEFSGTLVIAVVNAPKPSPGESVKAPMLVAVPPFVVTLTLPVFAPCGTAAVILVAERTV